MASLSSSCMVTLKIPSMTPAEVTKMTVLWTLAVGILSPTTDTLGQTWKDYKQDKLEENVHLSSLWLDALPQKCSRCVLGRRGEKRESQFHQFETSTVTQSPVLRKASCLVQWSVITTLKFIVLWDLKIIKPFLEVENWPSGKSKLRPDSYQGLKPVFLDLLLPGRPNAEQRGVTCV